MNWTALIYVLVILVLALSLTTLWLWPRTHEGKLMSLEEVSEFLDRFPSAPSGPALRWIIVLFALLAMIGTALTEHRIDSDARLDD